MVMLRYLAGRRTLRAALATAALGLGVGVTGVTLLLAQPAYAQAMLTPDQAQAIQAAVQNAIADVNAQMFASDEAKQAALADAIAGVMVTYVGANDASLTQAITNLVITTAIASSVQVATLGSALGIAATEIAETDMGKAVQVAVAVNNSNIPGLATQFASTVQNLGGPSEIGLIGVGGSQPPPCANPSCT